MQKIVFDPADFVELSSDEETTEKRNRQRQYKRWQKTMGAGASKQPAQQQVRAD